MFFVFYKSLNVSLNSSNDYISVYQLFVHKKSRIKIILGQMGEVNLVVETNPRERCQYCYFSVFSTPFFRK